MRRFGSCKRALECATRQVLLPLMHASLWLHAQSCTWHDCLTCWRAFLLVSVGGWCDGASSALLLALHHLLSLRRCRRPLSNATSMWVKVAGLSAECGDYKKAISIYEKVSRTSLENSALRWSVKDYLFRALLCHFVQNAASHQVDIVGTKLDQYLDMCPNMEGTREAGLIRDLLDDFNENDSDKFAEHVFTFDEIIKLDNFTAKVLLEIKKALEAGGPNDGDVGM
jgi:phosphopantetheinyl transferase (holo-ACP synthase)